MQATQTNDLAPSGRRARKPRESRNLSNLVFILPSIALSLTIIGYPIFEVLRMAVMDVNRFGKIRGFEGFGNFIKIFSDPVFIQSSWQTLIWTVSVVGGTVLVAVPVAIVLNEDFHGRSIARTIILLPWAVSLAMTALVWRFVVNGDFGTLNLALTQLGLPFNNHPWLADAQSAFAIEILVGILVSVPFTVTIILGGLTSIPVTLYEAAAMDGATRWQSLRRITLPMLSPFLQIAIVLNVIYVFNSFPIIWIMTNGGPANGTDILITYVYKQAFAFGKLDVAAAGSVVMFLMLLCFSVLYLFMTRNRSTDG
ncbi:ABC transporter permease [Sedimentitalea sp. CY04]|uniref:ABC transporter permease n=1 Tax=Parasedimentitalea denitrificans TaxID=2211118 RepID=A0ABX0WCV9_9RHOB|nr:sugar ABC transporter permease [Sedimentitalea sp. CY04]NIZ62100.1 ABC transporter permease [Sedimentitalea sp. CY04]